MLLRYVVEVLREASKRMKLSESVSFLYNDEFLSKIIVGGLINDRHCMKIMAASTILVVLLHITYRKINMLYIYKYVVYMQCRRMYTHMYPYRYKEHVLFLLELQLSV